MKHLPWIALAATAALLMSCSRPADQKTAAGPVSEGHERAGPVKWNATTGGFELGGRPLRAVKLWTFDGSTDGFTAVGSKLTPAPGQGLAVTVVDPTIRSPKGLDVPGAQYSLVLVRLTRTAGAAGWDGGLYYSTANHPEAVAYLGKPASGANPAVGETTTLVYDMSRQAMGAPDWMASTIDQLRLDIEDKPGGAFVIRQVAITENPNPAGSAGAAVPTATPTTAAPAKP